MLIIDHERETDVTSLNAWCASFVITNRILRPAKSLFACPQSLL